MNQEEGTHIPEGDYITLKQAAEMFGYSVPKGGSGNLRKAAKDGRLKTVRPGERALLTTREWFEAYLAGLQHAKGGRPKKSTSKPPEGEGEQP